MDVDPSSSRFRQPGNRYSGTNANWSERQNFESQTVSDRDADPKLQKINNIYTHKNINEKIGTTTIEPDSRIKLSNPPITLTFLRKVSATGHKTNNSRRKHRIANWYWVFEELYETRTKACGTCKHTLRSPFYPWSRSSKSKLFCKLNEIVANCKNFFESYV